MSYNVIPLLQNPSVTAYLRVTVKVCTGTIGPLWQDPIIFPGLTSCLLPCVKVSHLQPRWPPRTSRNFKELLASGSLHSPLSLPGLLYPVHMVCPFISLRPLPNCHSLKAAFPDHSIWKRFTITPEPSTFDLYLSSDLLVYIECITIWHTTYFTCLFSVLFSTRM